ncbi:hypothetical protein [Chryseobacterium sp. Leaf201]|uniref:hypothetical protein n=1 Tax=Chryseobacterium sp. Leaf201 TaxID=1735672 RepID=UPI0006FB1CAE|nr:hypothetical protein [Chryseobacterium sp. Leaf201]KQM34724.1 hypothetical protein ASE55_15715 [Chryseobacterium sp. Leaf201]
MRTIIVVLFQVSFLTPFYGQNFNESALLNLKQNRSENVNLHGPIKSAYWYYTYVSDTLETSIPIEDAKGEIMYFNRNIGGAIFTSFDNKGRLIKRIQDYGNSMDLKKNPLLEKYATTYLYEDRDLQQKENIRLLSYPKYPVFNDYQLVKQNFLYKDNRSQNNYKSLFGYTYLLDDKKRIKQEKFYLTSESDKFIIKEEDLITKTDFIYNNKGNLIKQTIKPGAFGKEMPFTAMDTESSYCTDLHFSYDYDELGRITKMIFFGCGNSIQTESYSYDTNENTISKNEINFNSSLRSKVYITKKTIMYYDKFGNIIHKQYVTDSPTQKLIGFMYQLPEHTYYKYKYDQYNNWYQCDIYMKGESGPITATIKRELEYY